MIDISIKDVNNGINRAQKILAGFGSGAADRAIAAAMKRSGEKAKTQASKLAAGTYQIGSGVFSGNVNTTLTINPVEMALKFRGKNLKDILFKTYYGKGTKLRQSNVRGSGGPLDRAFVLHGDVYRRDGPKRFPIRKLYGPSTAQMMYREEVKLKMEETIYQTFEERIEHEILRVMNGWG